MSQDDKIAARRTLKFYKVMIDVIDMHLDKVDQIMRQPSNECKLPSETPYPTPPVIYISNSKSSAQPPSF
jgi:hypothetical protein